MLKITFDSMFKSVSHKLYQLQSLHMYVVHICIYMIAAAASDNCMILAYMTQLNDFGVCHCFKGKTFSSDGYL